MISPRFSKICTEPISGRAAEIDRLLDPGVDHPLDVGDLHLRERQIVAGREAEHAADAGFALGDDAGRRRSALRGASALSAAKSLSNTKVCA